MSILSTLIGIVNPVAGIATAAAGKAKAVAASIPWFVWAGLAAVALLWLGGCVHSHKVKAFGKERYAAGVKAEHDHIVTQLAAVHQQAIQRRVATEAKAATISNDIRGRNEEDIRAHSASAAAILRGGSGAARCRPGDNPGVSSSSSGSQPASASANAAGPGLPSEDRAAVPWSWLIARGQEHDDLLSEVKSWREWHARQSKPAP